MPMSAQRAAVGAPGGRGLGEGGGLVAQTGERAGMHAEGDEAVRIRSRGSSEGGGALVVVSAEAAYVSQRGVFYFPFLTQPFRNNPEGVCEV